MEQPRVVKVHGNMDSILFFVRRLRVVVEKEVFSREGGMLRCAQHDRASGILMRLCTCMGRRDASLCSA